MCGVRYNVKECGSLRNFFVILFLLVFAISHFRFRLDERKNHKCLLIPIDEILCIGLRAFESELATRQIVRDFVRPLFRFDEDGNLYR